MAELTHLDVADKIKDIHKIYKKKIKKCVNNDLTFEDTKNAHFAPIFSIKYEAAIAPNRAPANKIPATDAHTNLNAQESSSKYVVLLKNLLS